MYRLGEVELVYICQTKDDNYNPVNLSYSRLVKCSLRNAFSANYYNNQTRDMRRTRNIIVSKDYTHDVYIDSKRYQLEYAKLGAVKYSVRNILKDNNSSLQMILDCDEVINE